MTDRKYNTFADAGRGSLKNLKAITPVEKPSTRTSSIPSISRTSSTPVAPARDFQRVPNSVTRRAIPDGLFRGKSKQVWDYLWSVSRGAIVPARMVRKSRKEIKAGSGLGSMVTVDAAIEHLQAVGLISIKSSIGSLSGNEYEVFTPDEASTRTPSISSTSSPTQNLVELDVLDSSISSTTQLIENTGTSDASKTSFKTKEEIDDDDALAGMAQVLRKAAKEVTGREPALIDADRWRELGEILAAELKIAAARTTVSSAPSFLAEHLRRRLWKLDKKQATAEGKELPDEKTSSPSHEQPRDCPDCGGSGWCYPEGIDKGVAKCIHLNLKGA